MIPPRPIAAIDASLETYADANGRYLRNTALGNILNLCAVTLPCGFTADGLPLGLMIYAKPFDEATALRVAWAYEQATDWHRRRPDLAWARVRERPGRRGMSATPQTVGTLPQAERRDFSGVGYDEAMRRAREIVPVLRERARGGGERRGPGPPAENEQLLHETGLFRYHQPRAFGGMELPFVAVVDIAAEIARAVRPPRGTSATWASTTGSSPSTIPRRSTRCGTRIRTPSSRRPLRWPRGGPGAPRGASW